MAIGQYLAMTAGEIRSSRILPEKIGWMACHFSASGSGLSNLPTVLPPGSLLILDDSTPINTHDPEKITGQLEDCVKRLGCAGVLLDFQRPMEENTSELVRTLEATLPCPLIVPGSCAKGTTCPVFLPPIPADMLPEDYLAPWQGREIWLEAALDAQEITLTENGAAAVSLPRLETPETDGFADTRLHCHYRCEVFSDKAVFTLWRSPADLQALLEEAESLGVTAAVGLYQELETYFA